MDMLDQIKKRLEGKNLSEVARRADMAYGTVHSLATGKSDDIFVSTHQRLSKVLDGLEVDK